ncbi:MAG: hypothetical protein H0T79_15185 [Deltaproteobacteria bacterium]|nr:hypothetical protein [Deltaproteobacteria bacterium]
MTTTTFTTIAPTNRLANIVIAQRKTRVRDVLFAAFVALATVMAVTSVGTAASAASRTDVAVTQR